MRIQEFHHCWIIQKIGWFSNFLDFQFTPLRNLTCTEIRYMSLISE